MRRALVLVALLVFQAACNKEGEGTPKTSEGLGYEDLFADDIDQVLTSIDLVAEPGRYDVMEPLLDLCRTHPSEQVRQSAGKAIEVVSSETFGLADSNERRRTQALGKAMQWWAQRRESLLLGVLVERIRPHLSKDEDYRHSEEARAYLLMGVVQQGLPTSLSAVEWLRLQSRGLEHQLADMMSHKDFPPLMKERLALAIGGSLPSSVALDFEGIAGRASDPLVQRALFERWARHDPDSAVRTVRQAIADAASSEQREGLIRTAWGFDRPGVEAHLQERLKQEDVETWEISLAGQMGLDSLRADIIRWALARELDDDELLVLKDAAKSLDLRVMAGETMKQIEEEADRRDAGSTDRVLTLLIKGFDEEVLIGFLSRERIWEASARALGSMGSKSAVPPMINHLGDANKSAAALEALEAITGRDFSRVDPGEFEAYLRHEPGDPASLRPKFIKNRAQLWWSEHADLTRSQWLSMALNEAGFNVIRNDKHEMGERERVLLERILDEDPMEAPGIFKALMETEQDRNVDFVVRAVVAKRSPSWAEALLPWVDRPLDRNSRKAALAFCASAGPGHHRQLLALLKSQHADVMTSAARSLERWGGFRAVASLIENVEYGSEEQAVLAQEVLSNISGVMASPILGLTKPQRQAAVRRWRSWWQSVADDTQPGGWQKREVERLLGELTGGPRTQPIWDRLEAITGLPQGNLSKERWQGEWARVSHPQWTLHGRDIVHLSGNNFERFLLARSKLLQDSTRDDIRQMARMAAEAHAAFRATFRRLTGVDPSDRESWEQALSDPRFPAQIRLEREERKEVE